MELLTALKWRYATKLFDSEKKLSEDQVQKLIDSFLLTPSSYGIEPWKLLVITDPEIRKDLRSHSWNQSQIEDCSHLFVFLHKKEIKIADVQHFIDHIASVRGVENKSELDGYKGMMISHLVDGDLTQDQIQNWAKQQNYIALGQMMLAAALMQIDTCPIEGFSAKEYDRILNLENTEYTTSVVLPVGYRHKDDKYAHLKKVRFEESEMVERR